MEGDLVVDSSSSTLIIRDVVVTIAVGRTKKSKKDNLGLVRYRDGEDFSTYIVHHYHL